jgi:Domain of unknown function (DUF5753)
MTAASAGAELGWSEGKVLYLESRRSRRPDPHDIALLADLYASRGARINPELRDALIRLARDAREPRWWQPWEDVLSEDYATYIGLEAEASEIWNTEPLVIPGLFQTLDYARALAATGEGRRADAQRRAEIRAERQKVLTRSPQPLRLHAVIGEAALRVQIGGPEVLAAQLTHLAEIAGRPHIEVLVVPFDAGAWPGLPGSFAILRFPRADDPDAAYLETQAGQYWAEDPVEVHVYHDRYRRCAEASLSPTGSLEMIRRRAAEIAR